LRDEIDTIKIEFFPTGLFSSITIYFSVFSEHDFFALGNPNLQDGFLTIDVVKGTMFFCYVKADSEKGHYCIYDARNKRLIVKVLKKQNGE